MSRPVLKVACPACKVGPGEWCRDSDGNSVSLACLGRRRAVAPKRSCRPRGSLALFATLVALSAGGSDVG